MSLPSFGKTPCYRARRPLSVYESYSREYVHAGEDSRPVPSLEIVTREYAAITARRPDPLTGSKRTPKWTKVTREQYESLPKVKNERADAPAPPKAAGTREEYCSRRGRGIRVERPDANRRRRGAGTARDLHGRPDERPPPRGGRVLHVMSICYHADLKKVIYFGFWDKPAAFVESSAKFNQIMDSVRSGT
jgi:hypothetical protein